MRKNIYRIFGFLLIVLALIHLTEGDLLDSLVSHSKLSNYAIPLEDDLLACENVNSSDKSIMLKIYNDKKDPNVYYILEYSRNSLLPYYSLKDVTKYDTPASTINSVASTVFSHYPYSFDLQNQIITIYEKANSFDWIHSVFVLGLGFLFTILPHENSSKHKEKNP